MQILTTQRASGRVERAAPARAPHPLSVPGLLFATSLFLSSVTPSLIPRTWYLQGLASGICAAYGYGLGVLVARVGRSVARRLELRITVSPTARRRLVQVGRAGLAVTVVGVWTLSWLWQRTTAELVGLPPASLMSHGLGLVATIAVFAVLLLSGRGLRALRRRWSRTGRRFVPRVVAAPTALLLVGSLVWFVSNRVVYRGFLEFTAEQATRINATVPAGRSRPESPLRSGSPASHESWTSLGRNGQAFVADGPRAAQIAAATGAPAKEPIRVYAGPSDGRSIDETADAAVAELRRTGALDRSVLAVITTTGRGWVDEWTASSIEYLSSGDSAIVAIQYSYLPSFVALLTDRTAPAVAGRLLLTKVRTELSRRPVGQRPRLLVGGESLGAYGGQAAFTDADDMLGSIEGAVWVGTPNATPLWRDLTVGRQGGSPEIAPVVDDGAHIRFVTSPADLTQDLYGRAYGIWAAPRVVYAQHASDPVTWWSPNLLTDEPDWLRERVGRDVNDMRWASFASFWQLTTDLVLANGTPPGHGHRYTEELLPAWAGVLGLDPTADYSRVVAAISAAYRPV